MKEVRIIDILPFRAMEIVRELREMGHRQGIDFDFEYHKPEIIVDDYEGVYNRFTLFKFYDEGLATWFSLRYL